MSTPVPPARNPPIVIESQSPSTAAPNVAQTQTPVVGPPRREEIEIKNAPAHDEPVIVEAHEEEHATDSHALAHADHDEKGIAQLDHGATEVKDLGWNEPQGAIPAPLVGGLENEELWTLLRRFNKVCYLHIKPPEDRTKTDILHSKCIMSSHYLKHLLGDSI